MIVKKLLYPQSVLRRNRTLYRGVSPSYVPSYDERRACLLQKHVFSAQVIGEGAGCYFLSKLENPELTSCF